MVGRAIGCLAFSLLVGAVAARAEEIRFFRIGTASSDGSHFVIGTLIAGAISNPPGTRPCHRGGSCGVPGLIAVAQATAGPTENLELLRVNELEAAIVPAGLSLSATPGLAAVASLYPEQIHLVVNAAGTINTVADLKGRRIAVGEPGSEAAAEVIRLLAALGLAAGAFEPHFLDPATAAEGLATGAVDAVIVIGGAPSTEVADLASRLTIRLVPLPVAETVLAGARCCFETSQVPEGAYADVATVPTLAVPAVLLVRADVSEALVYDLAAAIWHPSHQALFEEAGATGQAIRVEGALRNLPIPLHPGALRYYRERGLLDGTVGEGAAPAPGQEAGRDAMVFPLELPPG